MAIDYSKFSSIGDEDDDVTAEVKRAVESHWVENSRATHYSRGLLADPLCANVFKELHQVDDMEVKINTTDAEKENLLAFVAVQQYDGGGSDNTLSAPAIMEFMQKGRTPKSSLLLAFTWAVDKRIAKSGRSASETQPIMNMLLGAINTLLAADKQGSARALFEELKREPDSAFATRYFGRELGKARYEKYRAKAHYEETRWRYGDLPPWRDYTDQRIQDGLDGFFGGLYNFIFVRYPSRILYGGCFVALFHKQLIQLVGILLGLNFYEHGMLVWPTAVQTVAATGAFSAEGLSAAGEAECVDTGADAETAGATAMDAAATPTVPQAAPSPWPDAPEPPFEPDYANLPK